jgi:Putative Actinobacterial Holin-X, holin superfamily III
MSMPMPERSVAELLTNLSRQLSTLFRQEAQLARAEVAQRLHGLTRDAVVIGVGAALALAALLAATAALVLLLIQLNVMPWIAAVIVAAVLAIVALVLVQTGLRALRQRTIVPIDTVESIKETAQWIKKETAGSSTDR